MKTPTPEEIDRAARRLYEIGRRAVGSDDTRKIGFKPYDSQGPEQRRAIRAIAVFALRHGFRP